MGNAKSSFFVILLLSIIFVVFIACVTSHHERRDLIITGIYFTDSNIIIHLERRSVSAPLVEGIIISYDNVIGGIGVPARVEDGNEVILTVDLTDIIITAFDEAEDYLNTAGILRDLYLFINEEATLTIWLIGGGRLYANIFIGEDRIDILDQRFWYRRWR